MHHCKSRTELEAGSRKVKAGSSKVNRRPSIWHFHFRWLCPIPCLSAATFPQIIDELFWQAFKVHHEAKRARAVDEKKRQAQAAAARAQDASLMAAAAPAPPAGQPEYEVRDAHTAAGP